MTKNYSEADVRRLWQQAQAAIGWTELTEVTLGAEVNGARYIGAGGTRVWVTQDGRSTFTVERGDANIPDSYGKRVLNGDGVDPVQIGQHQITDLLVLPDTGFTVRILPGIANVNGTLVEIPPGTFFTLDDSEVPAGAGEAVICRLELDNTGAFHDSYGSDYAEPVPNMDALAEAPAATAERNTLAYIWIPAGATGLQRNSILPTSLAERTGGVAGGSTVESFTDLDDVPSSYSGQAGNIPVVNATEDGLEFVSPSGVIPGTLVYERWDVDAPPASPHASDDEFDGSVSGSWNDFDHGSIMTYAASPYGKGVRMVVAQGSNGDVCGLLRTAPAGDFSIAVCIEWAHLPVNFRTAGILFAEGLGSSANVTLWQLAIGATSNAPNAQLQNFSAYNTQTTTPISIGVLSQTRIYLRVRRISSTYYLDISADGRGWLQLGTDSMSNLSSLTHIGIGARNINASNGNLYVTFPFVRFSTNTDLDAPVHGQPVGIYAPP